MKKMTALLLASVMTVSLAACGGNDDDDAASSGPGTQITAAEKDETEATHTIKIGVFEPTTGENSNGGKQEVLGIQYANSAKPTVTIGGEEYKIELDIQDNQSSTDKAVSAAQQLVADKVSVVLGSYGSGVSIAAGTYFANAKIPAIGCSCTNAAVTAGNDYYFRVCFLDPFQGSVMASFAMEEFGAKKAYVLSMLGDDYTVGLAKNFVIAFEAAGGEIVADETFVEGTADFSAYLNNAVAGGADVNALNTNLETPLHMAVWKNNLGMVGLLLRNGADPNIRNIKDSSPWDWAVVAQNHDFITLFESVAKCSTAAAAGFSAALLIVVSVCLCLKEK